jgi:negative regulator of sigma E activity
MKQAKGILAGLFVLLLLGLLPMGVLAQADNPVVDEVTVAFSEPSDWLTAAVVGVMAVVTLAALWLIKEVLPFLHESISRSNMGDFYQTVLPIAGKYTDMGAQELIQFLERRAAETETEVDDNFVALLKKEYRVAAGYPIVGSNTPDL